MKPLYRCVRHFLRDKRLLSKHVCGYQVLQCATCGGIFCSECDSAAGGSIPKCCTAAIDAFAIDLERKQEKLRIKNYDLAMAAKARRNWEKTDKKKVKQRVKIEEIENGNKL
jgi:hypothetical protein